MASPRQVVVVGASLAGLRAVEALRRRGYDGSLKLVGAESHLPYDRPPLSKQVLDGSWEPERTRLRSPEELDELDLELLLGRRAHSLDPGAGALRLDDGASLDFDALVIATGAAPRNLPDAAGLSGVHVLRGLDDALALRAALERSPRVVVVGGGFIGLEVASVCRGRGLSVTVVEMAERPLQPVLGELAARAIASLHEDAGVELRCGVAVEALEGAGQVEAVRLSDGSRVPADVVVVGIGVRPNTDWLEGSGVALDDGVVCDATLATAVPGVVAAGDVARWDNPTFGRAMRVEHWTNAVEQANAAVARLLDGDQAPPFASVPYFWSDQLGQKIQFAGDVHGHDRVELVEGSLAGPRGVALYGRGGRVTGVLTLNHPARMIRFRRRIADGLTWEEALEPA